MMAIVAASLLLLAAVPAFAQFSQCRDLTLPGQTTTLPVCVGIDYGSACSITLRVTAAGITVLNEPVDLAVTAPICPTIGGCATCIEVTPSGATGACVSIVRTCGSDDPQHIELGCIPTFPLTHCLQCNCHGHGHCDSNNACVCDAGWSGTTCLDRPSMLDKCVTVHVGKDWAVCGRLSQDDCSVRATLTLDGNQVLARGIPVLQLAHTGTGSACISVGVCEACIVLSDVAINGALTAMTGRADVRVKCVASAQQPLGTFNAASDYKDIETRCFPCKGNCTGRGTCRYDGKCLCRGAYYGSACQFQPCPLGDAGVECGGDAQGTCVATTGACSCEAGFEGPRCDKSSKLWVIGAVVGALLAVSIAGALVYMLWWRRRGSASSSSALAEPTENVVNWLDEEEATAAEVDADF